MDEEGELALLGQHSATGEQLAEQAARWQAQVAILSGAAAGPPLPTDAALALLAAHRSTVQTYATQQAQWDDHLATLFAPVFKPALLADPAIAAYYQSARAAKQTSSRQTTRKARERKAWELLRQKVLATASPAAPEQLPEQPPLPPTRSKPMATDATPEAQLPIDWDTRPEHAAAHAADDQAAFEHAKARTLHADPATLGRADRYARSQALAAINQSALAAAMAAPVLPGRAAWQFTPAAPAVANTIEPAPAPTPSPEQIQQQAERLNSVIGTAGILLSAPKDALTSAEGDGMASDDIATVTTITEPALRTTALLAVAESRHAQAAYRAAFDRQAPALAAEVETAVATRFGEQYASQRSADASARQQAIDAAASAQVAAARARDRQQVAQALGWNTLERADAPTATPTRPTAVNLAKPPSADATTVPHEVKRAFLHVGNKFHMLKNKERVAFEDHGLQIKTVLNDTSITHAMVQIAHARGWESIKVTGTHEFRQQAWRAAALCGMTVQGYTPTELDKADLARRMPQQPAKQAAKPATTPPTAEQGAMAGAAERRFQQVMAEAEHWLNSNGKTANLQGMPPAMALESLDQTMGFGTGSMSENAKAQGRTIWERAEAAYRQLHRHQEQPGNQGPGAPVAPHPGDTLVAHGPAKYQHKPENADSYYVTLANAQGKQRTIWGVALGEAIAKAGAKVGDPITLTKNGERVVEVDEKIKNDAGAVVGSRKIGAVRNDWKVMAHAVATQPAAHVAGAHPELAGALAVPGIVDLQAKADGFSPEQRAIIAARAQQNMVNSIERGTAPTVKLREAAQQQPRQELAQ